MSGVGGDCMLWMIMVCYVIVEVMLCWRLQAMYNEERENQHGMKAGDNIHVAIQVRRVAVCLLRLSTDCW